jgi:DnaK suppressor protein
MDHEQVDEAPEEQLKTERARIENELHDLRGGASSGPDYDSNFADTSQVTAERGEAEALVRELGDTLDQIDAALQRIEDGTYGKCDSCGNDIGSDRLAAMPAAAKCISCASKG